MIYLDLILNLSLLVAITIVSDFIDDRWPRHTWPGILLQGILFGGAAVVGMLRPLDLGHGLIFDGRSIMVSLCALYFGPKAVAVAGIMAIVCRISLGGAGMITGSLTILSSAGVGLVARYRLKPEVEAPSWQMLFLLGLLVHAIMLGVMFTLPGGAGLTVIKRIGLPVILLYPMATILAGKILSDQREKKWAMNGLRKSEERFRLHFENISDVIYSIDTEFKLVDISPSVEKILGYTPEELIGKPFQDLNLLASASLDQAVSDTRRILESEQIASAVYQFIAKDGTEVWGEISGAPSFDNGQVVAVVSVARDITERKRAEDALRESQGKLNAIFQASPDPMIVYDTQGHPTYLNPAFETVFGWTLDELRGEKIPFVPEEEVEVSQREIRRLYEAGSPVRLETKRLTKDGRTLDISISAGLLHDARGERAGMVVNLTDITEVKKLEARFQQAQKMESVGRLAGGVAHDFNNKLTAILGYTELALGKLDPSDALYADLHKVLEAGNQSTNIVRQLLAFARKQTIAPKAMILNDTVKQILKMLRRLIGEDIDLAWEPGGNLWLVNMDPTQIDQILANLCVNAKDAIEGGGKVTIETENVVLDETYCGQHPGAVPGEYVMLAVSDDGIGMDKETLANVFEPFFTTKEVGKGTGLGLSTVYGIVKQNNGFVSAYSEPGMGASFKVYLPRHTGETEAVIHEEKAEIPRGQGEITLVVEDEPMVLEVIESALKALGYEVFAFGNPVDAMEAAKKFTSAIQLLVTDVIMPEMSGKELSQALKEISPKIKILYTSGYTANAIVNHGVLNKGIRFIQKPFNSESLARKIREALDEK